MGEKYLARLPVISMDRQQMPTFLPGSALSCSLYAATRAGSGTRKGFLGKSVTDLR